MNTVFTLLLNIFITAIGYLSVPVLLCISGKKYPLSKLKKIVIINGIVFWLIFSIISINAGNEGFGASVVLWSGVAYFILKNGVFLYLKKIWKKQLPMLTKHLR